MTEQLRILMISHQRRFKAVTRPRVVAKSLVERGHQVTLIVTANTARAHTKESDWDGVHLIETPDLLWGRLRSGWDLWNLANRVVYLNGDREPYDLIHCFETRPATIYPALYYRRRHPIPLLTDWIDWFGRGGLIEVHRPRWYRTLFGGIETYYEEAFRKDAAGLTVISTGLGERAASLGVARNRICYLPGGTFPEIFHYRTKEECRSRLGFSQTDPILAFSKSDYFLDLDFLMASMSIVSNKYPSVKLIITGTADSQVVALARAHGVESHLHMTGFLPIKDLPWYLGCADVFALPFPNKIYNVGRWPGKIGDYMCLGRPTVSNPIGDVKTLFEDYRIGLLAECDPADFAGKIIYLLENPDIAAELGRNALNTATTVYDWRILIRRLEEFYYSILEKESLNQRSAVLSKSPMG